VSAVSPPGIVGWRQSSDRLDLEKRFSMGTGAAWVDRNEKILATDECDKLPEEPTAEPGISLCGRTVVTGRACGLLKYNLQDIAPSCVRESESVWPTRFDLMI
jgi:hypothetical protein